jgi:RHS repeat-associated protein
MPYKAFLPILAQGASTGYGSPPAATLSQPFAVVSTTAGLQAVYDANGNMTLRVEMSGTQSTLALRASAGVTYTQQWDVENRLSVVTNTVSGEVTRFVYNADGARVLQFLPDGSRTVYAGALEISITGTQRITKTYYSVGAQMVALRVISSTGNVLYYLHGDHLGSVSLVTSAAGVVVAQQLYTPFGVPRWISGTLPTDVGFTAQRADATGLMFYNARYYSASLGRYISSDTIIPNPANPQLFNRYSYAGNNPVLYNDPDGHCGPLCIALAFGVGALGGVMIADLVIDNIDSHGWAYEPAYHKQYIEQAAGNIPPIALGAGLGVQSASQNWGADFAQAIFKQLAGMGPASVGPAQIRPGEMGNDLDTMTLLNNHEAGIAVLASKMGAADAQFMAASKAHGYKATMTDRMIILAIAQNGLSKQGIEGLFNDPYYSGGRLDWDRWFFDADTAAMEKPIDRVGLYERATLKSWTRWQLTFFVDNLQRLIDQGWKLPEGLDWDYMKKLAGGP